GIEMKPKLLIVDDDEEIRSQMKWAFNLDYEVSLAEDRASALEMCKEHQPWVVLLDLGLPPAPATPEEGLATCSEILSRDPLCKVIIITGQSEKQNALEAIGRGAYDCLSKPVNIDEAKIIVKRAFHVASLEREVRSLQNHLQHETFEGM